MFCSFSIEDPFLIIFSMEFSMSFFPKREAPPRRVVDRRPQPVRWRAVHLGASAGSGSATGALTRFLRNAMVDIGL